MITRYRTGDLAAQVRTRNYDRLRGIKATHDPDNLFSRNRNILPGP